MEIKRHKVFISYHHMNDQEYKDALVNMKYYDDDKKKYQFIFDDYSVSDNDIDDDNMTDEQIRRKIRDNYINGATVFILLCGTETKHRKHIDWEIHAAMYDSDANSKMGILVINLPSLHYEQSVRVSCDEEKELVAPGATDWVTLDSKSEFEKYYPYMPDRLIDNFCKKNPITVVDWDRIKDNPELLMKLIDNTFNNINKCNYDYSKPLRKNNSCYQQN